MIATKESLDAIHPRQCIQQDFLVIWLDPDLNQSNKDCQKILLQLRNVVNEVNIFSQLDECIDYLTDFEGMKAILIIEDTLGRQISPFIDNLPQIDSMYIFNHKKSNQKQWAQTGKIKGIYTDVTSICESLQQVVKQLNQDAIPMSFIAVDERGSPRSLNELESSFMYTQLLKEVLFKMEYDEQAIKNFIAYCRNGEHGSPINITRFENEYNPQSAIWWYTNPSFIFSLLNTALRTLQADTIVHLGFFIHDLHQQIEQLYQKQNITAKETPLIVYRGQGLSIIDFDKLKNAEGGLMSFNNFLSTSRNQEVSLVYAYSASTKPDTIGVLFRMSINPSISPVHFADIGEVSYYKSEEEILFSMHTIFRIGEIKPMDDNNSIYEVDLKLTSDDDPQLRILTEYIEKELAGCTGWTKLGALLYKTGHFNQAEELFKTLLVQTSDETEKAGHCNNLGCLKVCQTDYEKAIWYYKTGLEFVERTSPPDQLALISFYNNIGGVYTYMKEWPKALSFYEKGLAIGRKNLPPTHPNLAHCYNNIGIVYEDMSEYSKAFSYYEKSLEVRKQSLPSNHPDLAVSYNNISAMCRKMGEYLKAYRYLKKSLEIRQKTLPPEHPDFANAYMNIGTVCNSLGRYTEAISFYQKALKIEEKNYGLGHSKLATSYNNMAEAYQNNGEYSQALSFYKEVLKIRQKNTSTTDPDLATTYNNISTLYDALGEYSEAVVYFIKAMEIRKKILSPNHLDIGQSYNNIASVYYKMGDYQKALSYYKKSLKIIEINLHPYHPLFANCYDNIGLVHASMEDYTKALSFHKQAIDIREKTLPANHPDLAQSFNNIATLYTRTREYSNAIMYYKRALNISQRSLPTNHPNIRIIQENLQILQNQM